MSLPPTQRFTGRTADYAGFRPGYPAGIVSFLERTFGVLKGNRIADVGSGTGKLTHIFLAAGYAVLAVEPNRAMRLVAEQLFASDPGFLSLAATAEELPFRTATLDLLVAGQSFHWFRVERVRDEFRRVLKPQGALALIWNNRRTADSAFLHGYEALLDLYCPDYANVGNKHYNENVLADFFGASGPKRCDFRHHQSFDLEGLKGRLMSSSYAPKSGPNQVTLLAKLEQLFERHAVDGRVEMPYNAEVHYGMLA